ncbi:glycosyltransferase, partial [Parabacteroides sp. AM08-6]|uniref:glycosyltransferase n=1 Tax=Parabacteroides sp. AM08-6 TaxID=2292053 RepID=UPI000EFF975E
MKKIYIFNSDSRAAVYGIGTYLEQLVAVCLKMPDVVLSVVKLYSDKEEVTCERKDGYDLLSIPMDFGNEEKMKDRYFFHALYVLLANFQIDEDENVIFHFNYNIPLNLILFVKNTIPNSKIVYTIHYQTWAFSLNGNLKRFRSIINSEGALPGTRESNIKEQFYKEKDFYAAIDKIICISRFTKSLLMHDFGIEESRIALIYNGLKDDGGNVSMQSKERIKKKIGVIPGEKVILFVGRLDSIKGLSYLINAFKLVLNKDSHVHLYILGDGDFSDYLALIKEYWNKVTFTGRLNK